MKANWVRTGVVSLVAALLVVTCDDNPVDEDRDDTAVLAVNPSFAIVDAADTTAVNVSALNKYGDPTLGGMTFSTCDAKIEIEADPERVSIEPPDRVLVIGLTLGESCVVAASGSLTDTAVVSVVPAGIEVVSAPDTLRAGDAGEVVVQAIDAAGASVGPFARTDVTYTSGDSAVVTPTDDAGSVSSATAGAADITATWDAGGVTRDVAHTVEVVPNVPASVALASASFGALGGADSVKLEVIVSDALGNQNTEDSEILGATAMSSAPGVATARADLVPSNSVNVIVTVLSQSAGSADISGTVTTTEGVFAYGPASVFVLNPIISTLTPNSGPPAAAVAASGSGFTEAGFETIVTVDGELIGFADVQSATDIALKMPVFAASGDYDVVVSVGGIPSAAATWTQTGIFDAEASEPANDDPGTAPEIGAPFDFAGSFGGTDGQDFFLLSLSDSSTIEIELDWDSGKDLDLIVQEESVAIPMDATFAAYGNDLCDFTGATSGQPEVAECVLGPGVYAVHAVDFDFFVGDNSPSNITLSGRLQ